MRTRSYTVVVGNLRPVLIEEELTPPPRPVTPIGRRRAQRIAEDLIEAYPNITPEAVDEITQRHAGRSPEASIALAEPTEGAQHGRNQH